MATFTAICDACVGATTGAVGAATEPTGPAAANAGSGARTTPAPTARATTALRPGMRRRRVEGSREAGMVRVFLLVLLRPPTGLADGFGLGTRPAPPHLRAAVLHPRTAVGSRSGGPGWLLRGSAASDRGSRMCRNNGPADRPQR